MQLPQDHPPKLIEQAVQQALAYGGAHADGVKRCLQQLVHPDPQLPQLSLDHLPTLQAIGQQVATVAHDNQLLGGH